MRTGAPFSSLGIILASTCCADCLTIAAANYHLACPFPSPSRMYRKFRFSHLQGSLFALSTRAAFAVSAGGSFGATLESSSNRQEPYLEGKKKLSTASFRTPSGAILSAGLSPSNIAGGGGPAPLRFRGSMGIDGERSYDEELTCYIIPFVSWGRTRMLSLAVSMTF